MADELTPEMLQEAQPDLLTLEDEDGKECTFEVIDATEVNGTRYLAIRRPPGSTRRGESGHSSP